MEGVQPAFHPCRLRYQLNLRRKASSSFFIESQIIDSIVVVATVIWDGFTEALRVAKESSDWNPILKAALGGAVAVIDLGKVRVSSSRPPAMLTRTLRK